MNKLPIIRNKTHCDEPQAIRRRLVKKNETALFKVTYLCIRAGTVGWGKNTIANGRENLRGVSIGSGNK